VRVLVVAGAGHAAHLARPIVVRHAILDHIRTTATGGEVASRPDPLAAQTHGRTA